MELYLTLAFEFFKIGLFSYGGGYAVLPLIQEIIVHQHRWVSMETFTNVVAISQVTPGPIAINSATFIGYEVTHSIAGSFLTTFFLCLPSVIIMVTASRFFLRFRNHRALHHAFDGLRVAVIGLILAAALLLINTENFIDVKSIVIFGAAGILSYIGWHPILLTVIAGIAGILIYL